MKGQRALIPLRPFALMACVACAAPLMTAAQAQNVHPQREPAALPLPAPAQRAELQDVLPQHRLVGQGRLTFWGVQVYDASLWAPPGFKPDEPFGETFALELAYLRDFSSADIAERSIAEMRRSAAIPDAQAKTWREQLQRVLPDIKKGDRVIGLHRPGLGAQFRVNGKPAGDIPDAGFARLFFGIWLSPNTSEPALRAALLAGAIR